MTERDGNPVVFVGAGPGDPKLVTVAGKEALEQADLVVYAGSLVSQEMLGWCRDDCRALSSAGLDLERIIAAMAQAHAQGHKVVRLQTGDISLYGALPEQLAALEQREIPYRIIPGVTAAFAAAAALGLSYTLPEACQSLIFTRAGGPHPHAPGREPGLHGRSWLQPGHLSFRCHESRSGRHLGQGLWGPTAPSRWCSGPPGLTRKLFWTTAGGLAADLSLEGIGRQALILTGPAVAALRRGYGDEQKSKLYEQGL